MKLQTLTLINIDEKNYSRFFIALEKNNAIDKRKIKIQFSENREEAE